MNITERLLIDLVLIGLIVITIILSRLISKSKNNKKYLLINIISFLLIIPVAILIGRLSIYIFIAYEYICK